MNAGFCKENAEIGVFFINFRLSLILTALGIIPAYEN